MGVNICQRTGFLTRPEDLVKEPKTGLMVRRWEADPVHPQDYVRGKRETPRPDPSPEPGDTFLEPNDVTAESL